MSAPSRPLFIGLLSTLAIVGGLFFALKPPGKGADSSSQLNGPISQAQQAVVQSQIAAAKVEKATGSTRPGPAATSTPSTSLPAHARATPTHPAAKHATSSLPKLAAGDHSRKILTALRHHKVAVVLFWTHGGADDDSVRRAVATVSHHRRVAVFAIPSRQVGKYPAITTGVQITVSPTTLVIGPNHRFQEIVGYTYVRAITQAIALARH